MMSASTTDPHKRKMPPPKSTIPPAPQPKHSNVFDPWNSSSTGHQRAESKGNGTGWRQSRNGKLASQFKSGEIGGMRISDKVGPGSEDWDEKAKALIPNGVRARSQSGIRDMLVGKPNVVYPSRLQCK